MLRRFLQKALGVRLNDAPHSVPGRAATYSRKQMNAALKTIVVPHLRAMGFKGSLPHFRRARGDAVDLLSFQFHRSGGSFVVEIGRVSPDGFDFHGRHIPASKAEVGYCGGMDRYRLGSPLPSGIGDHWFDFAHREPDAVADEVCAELAREAVWMHVDELKARQ